ncbi:hypothetical protein C8J57DRAFT_1325972 [Mycena rebaudengoi]|nr:hypothetical protein C8J57DRAFT_1325972 [Mycena rebaudengoi]
MLLSARRPPPPARRKVVFISVLGAIVSDALRLAGATTSIGDPCVCWGCTAAEAGGGCCVPTRVGERFALRADALSLGPLPAFGYVTRVRVHGDGISASERPILYPCWVGGGAIVGGLRVIGNILALRLYG